MAVIRRAPLALAIAHAMPLFLVASAALKEQGGNADASVIDVPVMGNGQVQADGQGDDVGVGHVSFIAQGSLSTPLNSVVSS